MRLDKYLKVARLIKRRTVAKEVCEGQRVKINGRLAKPGAEVKIGDILEIEFGHKTLTIEVLELKDHLPVQLAGSLYRIVSETSKDPVW